MSRQKKLSGEQEQSAIAGPHTTFSDKLGTVAEKAEIHAKPSFDSSVIGTLVAGARVGRAAKPAGHDGCAKGWYAVSPRGFVCLDFRTTLDENHPTLLARGLPPNLREPLPYPYARTRREAVLYEPDPRGGDGVKVKSKLTQGSIFAVVGSWNAFDEYDQRQRLAMLTSGQFVSVRDIEPYRLPKTQGTELGDTNHRLPVALVEREEASTYRLQSGELKATSSVARGTAIDLTGKFRLIGGDRYFSTVSDTWVKESEVVVVRQRLELPPFASGDTHWADVDAAQGSVVLYEGRRPVHVSLLLSRSRSDLKSHVAYVSKKRITLEVAPADGPRSRERRDQAWVLELTDGTTLSAGGDGATSPGAAPKSQDYELRPEDARRLFHWVTPAVPEAWHGVISADAPREGSPLVVR